jgi:hypothetical protein
MVASNGVPHTHEARSSVEERESPGPRRLRAVPLRRAPLPAVELVGRQKKGDDSNSHMSIYREGYPSVQDLLKSVRDDIARRKRELDDDLNQSVIVEDKIITDRFAQIRGLKSHFNKTRQAKAVYNNQEVSDPHGHGTVTRGQLHRRATPKAGVSYS